MDGYLSLNGWDGGAVVILLCGGDKGSQQSDIRQAHEFASDYRSRK